MGAHASYSRTYFFASSFVMVSPDQSLVIGPLIASIRSQRACFCSGVSCRSEEHTSELQSLMRISYAVFCLKKKNNATIQQNTTRKHRTILQRLTIRTT